MRIYGTSCCVVVTAGTGGLHGSTTFFQIAKHASACTWRAWRECNRLLMSSIVQGSACLVARPAFQPAPIPITLPPTSSQRAVLLCQQCWVLHSVRYITLCTVGKLPTSLRRGYRERAFAPTQVSLRGRHCGVMFWATGQPPSRPYTPTLSYDLAPSAAKVKGPKNHPHPTCTIVICTPHAVETSAAAAASTL